MVITQIGNEDVDVGFFCHQGSPWHFYLIVANADSKQNAHVVLLCDVVFFREEFIQVYSAGCSMALWPSYLVKKQPKN